MIIKWLQMVPGAYRPQPRLSKLCDLRDLCVESNKWDV